MPEILLEADTTSTEITEKTEQTSPDPGFDTGLPDVFHFKLPVFEGPLDLLLHLIRKQKIDIYDIPICQITRQYMEYIGLMKELNLEIAGEFLVMSATLIHIKSRMLLPPEEEENEETSEDPRDELVKRLLEYQSFKDSSHHFRRREETWKDVFHRNVPVQDNFEVEPEPMLFQADVFDLITAFKKLLEKAPEQAVEISRETLTVKDRMNLIIERLEQENGTRFEDLFAGEWTKTTLIVTFLALLEVVRLGFASIYQEKSFSLIWILPSARDTAPETPHDTASPDESTEKDQADVPA